MANKTNPKILDKNYSNPLSVLALDTDEYLKPLDGLHNPNFALCPGRYCPSTVLYFASNKGRVFSFRISNSSWKELCGYDGGDYSTLCLVTSTGHAQAQIHRLIALLFCPNRSAKSMVHHIDDNKTNNAAYNLVWVTDAEHKRLHTELKLAQETGDFRSYNNDIRHIRASNEWQEEMRCITVQKEDFTHFFWIPADLYEKVQAGEIDWRDIDYTQPVLETTVFDTDLQEPQGE